MTDQPRRCGTCVHWEYREARHAKATETRIGMFVKACDRIAALEGALREISRAKNMRGETQTDLIVHLQRLARTALGDRQ